MTKQTEALKLALAVLKEWRKGFPDDWTDFDTEAVAAIREALAEQPALTATYTCGVCGVSMQMEQPAQQEPWVGLTEREENELWESTDSDWELMKRTEAKLREKNA